MSHVLQQRPAAPRSALPDEQKRWDHVLRIAEEHPPIPLNSVDFTVRDPELVVRRFGRVLDYMARAELEVERNVLELAALLPDAPEVDRVFFSEVWHHQEAQHGLILDQLLVELGHRPAVTNLDQVSMKIKVVGALAHVHKVQDVVRMLYYLTGLTTERSALLAYHKLQDGLGAIGETAIAESVITPIRRQEPGHYAYYQMSARELWARLSPWQQWLVRRLRALTFSPVGANSPDQRADAGDMMIALGIDSTSNAAEFAEQIARVECDLLWSERVGMRVPPYVARAFSEAVELAHHRAAA